VATIEWVNHASFVLRQGDVALLSDPWLSGTAFNDGWELLLPSEFTPADVGRVSHLWFSHEHPDHFSPPVLKQIPEDIRRRTRVVFQRTSDQRVTEYCRKLGFPVTEVADGEWHQLGPEVRMTIGRVPFYDSWALIEAGGVRILNLNDCVLNRPRDLARLARRVGRVDLLLTQFSYANRVGGPGDVELRREAAAEKLDWVSQQLAALNPKYCIPFASFSVFAHEENAYLNDERNTVDAAVEVIARHGVTPVVMAPGDVWTIGDEHDNAPAMSRYGKAFDVTDRPLRTHESVALDELLALATEYRNRVYDRNNRALLRLAALPPLRVGGPITIHLTDLDRVVRFSTADGLTPIDLSPDRAAIALHSQSLAFTLRFDFGVDTLSVNGRFTGTPSAYRRLLRAFAVSVLNNNGRTLSFRLLLDPWLVRRSFDRFVLRAS
jgi:hypothetical protein